ncbi:polysaccharide pyruvyl transferase family protein [uncultured Eubacterium sp.]|uniref:polysaccharide pyruvyl transferase family protein n=1 Tax=uncultured Eubacterium sp. TaxID=165185 RepID=UPI003264B5CD
MAVKILTFHRPYNYGAILQSLATQKAIEKLGYEVEIIDYRHPRIENERSQFVSLMKGNLLKNIKRNLREIRFIKVEKSRRKAFDLYQNKHYHLTPICESINEIKKNLTDNSVLVVGSDLVWNWELDTQLNPEFFSNTYKDISGLNMFSYASSIGSSTIPFQLYDKYKKGLYYFKSIGVREESAKNLLEEICDREVHVVLDPTMLHESEQWLESEEEYVGLPAEYICVYILEHTSSVIDIVEKMSKKMNLPIVFFGKTNRYNSNGINVYDASPGQFLYVIRNAKLVITNSFHGTVFSLLFHRSFICIPHSTRGTRMVDLLTRLNLEHNIVHSSEELRDVYSVSYDKVEKILTLLRKQSWEYLKENLASATQMEEE